MALLGAGVNTFYVNITFSQAAFKAFSAFGVCVCTCTLCMTSACQTKCIHNTRELQECGISSFCNRFIHPTPPLLPLLPRYFPITQQASKTSDIFYQEPPALGHASTNLIICKSRALISPVKSSSHNLSVLIFASVIRSEGTSMMSVNTTGE